MRPSTLLLFAVLALSGATRAAESGWPHWRGPNADGTSADATPPLRWSADSNIKWKTPIPGRGSSSPVVAGSRVFVTTALNTGKRADGSPAGALDGSGPGRFGAKPKPRALHEFVVLCIDRESGEILWREAVNRLVPHAGHHDDHGFASASPVTDGEHVWAHFGSRGTFCLAAATGKLVWSRTDLGQMTTRGGFGDGSSPALHAGRLVIPWDHEGESSLIALDAKSGRTIWRTPREHPSSWATPLVVEHDGRAQIIQNGEGSAVAYDFETGNEIWRADGQTARPVATPVASGSRVFIGSGFRGSFLGAYDLDGAKDDITGSEKVAWTVTKGTPDIASLLLTGGRLYFHSGKDSIISCFDARTGRAHYQRERLPDMGRVYASPVAANGHVYITDRDGRTAVLKDGPVLEVISVNSLGEPIDATPALAGRQILIRGSKHLYCVE